MTNQKKDDKVFTFENIDTIIDESGWHIKLSHVVWTASKKETFLAVLMHPITEDVKVGCFGSQKEADTFIDLITSSIPPLS